MRKLRAGLAAAAIVGIAGCGSSNSGYAGSTGATIKPSATQAASPGNCSSPKNCNTNAGQPVRGLTTRNPSDVQDVLGRLRNHFSVQAQQTLSPTGVSVQKVECAPGGNTGQFPSSDYVCSGTAADSAGQLQYIAPAVYSVSSNGAVAYVGSPCKDASGSGCPQHYWNVVESLRQP